jgi:excisionase family DNA binding protein
MSERGRLRTDQVADVLDVSTSTVIAHTKAGLLRTTRTPGGHRRYDGESVQELAKVLAMPDGPDRDAELEALRRRNREWAKAQPGNNPDPLTAMADLFVALRQIEPSVSLGAFLDGVQSAATGPEWTNLVDRARVDLAARFGEDIRT